MANLDTAEKRASSVQVLQPFQVAPPLPTGDVASERQHIAYSYGGISALTPVITPGGLIRALRQQTRKPMQVKGAPARSIALATGRGSGYVIVIGSAAKTERFSQPKVVAGYVVVMGAGAANAVHPVERASTGKVISGHDWQRMIDDEDRILLGMV